MKMSDKRSLLIADQEEKERIRMKDILGETYCVSCVGMGKEAISYCKEHAPDLVLLNQSLPDGDAGEIMRAIDESVIDKKIPFIIILDTMAYDRENYVLPERAMDFVVKPSVPAILLARTERVLEVSLLHRDLEGEIKKKKEQINRLSLQSLVTIAQTIDARDRFAKGHSVRVALYSRAIADKLNWDVEDTENLYHIALLHDIGNIAIQETLLNKASGLTRSEYEQIKKHTDIGGEMVKNIQYIPDIVNGVRYHHERYDGSGYAGVVGEEIPLAARIIAVADAYAAMTEDRAFRMRKTEKEAREELVLGRGTQFDPVVTDAFLELLDEGFIVDESSVEGAFSEEAIGETGTLLHRIFTDTVSEAKNEREKDSLTGFLNRRFFEEKIDSFLISPKSAGTFFMMDIDNFKQVNDRYGHVFGDKIILAFAEVIRMNTRENDYVCRMGGDEFAIFFPDLDKETVIRKRAESIILQFAQKRKELECEVGSVSVGIMIKHPGQTHIDCMTMYNQADKALYYVKNNGKDDYHMYAGESEEEKEEGFNIQRMDIRQLLRKIAERRYHQGAYAVEYDRFAYIYQFIARNVERSRQQVQIILFSIAEGNNSLQEEEMEDAMLLLETAVIRSLRRGDVTTRLSAGQQIVILMDTNTANGKIVADRIVEKYEDLSQDKQIHLIYDITDVPVKKKKEKDDK